jgi:hypothetical protein
VPQDDTPHLALNCGQAAQPGSERGTFGRITSGIRSYLLDLERVVSQIYIIIAYRISLNFKNLQSVSSFLGDKNLTVHGS